MLIALIRGRSDISADDVVGNVNAILVLFYDRPEVRRAYQNFCAWPNGPSIDVHRRYDELVLAVAASLKFNDLTAADIDLGYYPLPTTLPPIAVGGSQNPGRGSLRQPVTQHADAVR